MSNPLLSLTDIDYSPIQASVADVSTPMLAATISYTGVLGSLGLGASTVIQVRVMMVVIRQLTGHPFDVNLFCHAPPRRDARREADWATALRPHFTRYGSMPSDSLSEIYQTFIGHAPMLELLLDLSPAVVSFHFGFPERETVRRLRQQGIVTLATTVSPQETLLIEQQGTGAVVAQGYEADGYRETFAPREPDAQPSTFILMQLLRRRLTAPMIAAGGIMNGTGITSIMQLGAQGIQPGTASLLCPGSAADAGCRTAISNSIGGRTVSTSATSGCPAHCLANAFCALGEACPVSAVPDYPLAYDTGKVLAAAAGVQGVYEYSAHQTGWGVGLIREHDTTSLVRQLTAECGWN